MSGSPAVADLDEPFVGDPRERLGVRCDTQLHGRAGRHPRRLLGGERPPSVAALDDSAPEESLGRGIGQDGTGDGGTGRLPEQRDVPGIPAEGGDVLPHPAQGLENVEQAPVAGSSGQVEKPGDTESVVHGDEHDAVTGEPAAVVQ
jgi:hypothetical protein